MDKADHKLGDRKSRIKKNGSSQPSSGYVLAIDCGTQSLRAMVVSPQGQILAYAKDEYEPYFSAQSGYAEQDPERYYQAMVRTVQQLHQTDFETMQAVAAITVTTMRDTEVFLDEQGKVVRPSLIWLDQREAECKRKLKWYHRIPFQIVGMLKPVNNIRKQSKTNWLRENEPQSYDKARYILQVGGFLNFRLTGKAVDSVGNQIGHLPFDYKKQRWHVSPFSYKWDAFRMERHKLPQLVEIGQVIGHLTPTAASELGLPQATAVIANGADKCCETLGVGCLRPKQISLSFGTQATIQTTTDRYMEPLRFLPAYPSAIRAKFAPEITVYRGFWMIRWFKNEFAKQEIAKAKQLGVEAEELLDKLLLEVPPGADGLMLQPLWKPGLKNPEGRGSIIGFSDIHTRSHIYRAMVEGIIFSLYDGLQKIERVTKVKAEVAYVSGGGAESDNICQIAADVFGIKVVRGETYETAGLGAAINGYIGLGIYQSYEQAVDQMVRSGKIFYPDPKNRLAYKKIYGGMYRKLYPRLRQIYKTIGKR